MGGGHGGYTSGGSRNAHEDRGLRFGLRPASAGASGDSQIAPTVTFAPPTAYDRAPGTSPAQTQDLGSPGEREAGHPAVRAYSPADHYVPARAILAQAVAAGNPSYAPTAFAWVFLLVPTPVLFRADQHDAPAVDPCAAIRAHAPHSAVHRSGNRETGRPLSNGLHFEQRTQLMNVRNPDAAIRRPLWHALHELLNASGWLLHRPRPPPDRASTES